METYIKDLKLSEGVKTALSWTLQITKVSELEGLNYLTFANKCPKGRSEERRVGKECRSRWSPYH